MADSSEQVAMIGKVLHISNDRATEDVEAVAAEEPLEIRLAGLSVAVTMRTPGHDFDLVTGFLITEGILQTAGEIESMAYCPDEETEGAKNIINVNLRTAASLDPSKWQRNFYASSSCGVCGKASIDAVRMQAPKLKRDLRISRSVLLSLSDQLIGLQDAFRETGGLHAAGLFDSAGSVLNGREDVGRHNAVDKAIGAVLRSSRGELSETVLMVSGRASFEITQKALMVGIQAVAAVSAPSSLAVELARESGMTLVGFARENRFNVYSGRERLEG